MTVTINGSGAIVGSDRAESGVNDDITSLAGNAATATTAAACSGNAATATQLSTATGSAPSYSCRAWVNFNGTGTVAIRASGNVSSITDNGVGDYTVNFATAMPDAFYSVVSSNGGGTANPGQYNLNPITLNASAVRLLSFLGAEGTGAGGQSDNDTNCIVIFR